MRPDELATRILILSRLLTITPPALSHVHQRHLPAFADLLLARFQVPVSVPLCLMQSLSQSCTHAAIPHNRFLIHIGVTVNNGSDFRPSQNPFA